MLETLLDETKDVLDRVETATGLKIRLVPDEVDYHSSAALSAYLQSGSGVVEVSYNPSASSVNYAIAHSAVRIMRYHEAPPEERFFVSAGSENRALAYAQMERELEAVPADLRAVSKLGFSFFFNGVLTQLASQPGDPWIDKFLYEQYPGLRDEMRLGMEEIFEKAHKCIGPYARSLSPRAVFRCSNAMNSAYSIAADELVGQERFTPPYKGTEFEHLGKRLQRYNLTDRGLRGDKETADAWASELGLRGWFQWYHFSEEEQNRNARNQN